jgi:hypothetical protein
MKLFAYLFQLVSERRSEPRSEIAAARELPQNRRPQACVMFIGYRSPNDQLQVIALPRSRSEEWPRSGFPNSIC